MFLGVPPRYLVAAGTSFDTLNEPLPARCTLWKFGFHLGQPARWNVGPLAITPITGRIAPALAHKTCWPSRANASSGQLRPAVTRRDCSVAEEYNHWDFFELRTMGTHTTSLRVSASQRRDCRAEDIGGSRSS